MLLLCSRTRAVPKAMAERALNLHQVRQGQHLRYSRMRRDNSWSHFKNSSGADLLVLSMRKPIDMKTSRGYV